MLSSSGDHEENINPEVAKKVKDAAKRLEIQPSK
jgi:hypothetical protein